MTYLGGATSNGMGMHSDISTVGTDGIEVVFLFLGGKRLKGG